MLTTQDKRLIAYEIRKKREARFDRICTVLFFVAFGVAFFLVTLCMLALAKAAFLFLIGAL